MGSDKEEFEKWEAKGDIKVSSALICICYVRILASLSSFR